MNLKFRIFAAAFFVISMSCAMSHAASAEQAIASTDTPFYKELDDVASKTPGLAVGLRLTERIKSDGKLFFIALDWLKNNSIAQSQVQKFNSFYFLIYSDLLLQAGQYYKNKGDEATFNELTKSSLMNLLFFEMLLSSDITRCEDKSVSSIKPILLGFRFKGLQPYFGLVAKPQMQGIWRSAKVLDDKYAERIPNKEVCSSGAAVSVDMLKQPGTKTIEVADPKQFGGKSRKIIPPEGYAYQPTYIDNATWNAQRHSINDQVIQAWAERFP